MTIGITMIGTAATGKTCYLYAMASQMILGVDNFSFAATDYEVGLELEAGWNQICTGKWPAGSIESTDYEFVCSYAYRPLVTFSWHDYRGGILNELGQVDEQKKLFEKLNSSSCLIVCIPAEAIHGIVHGSAKYNTIFSSYARILQKYRTDNKKTIPIVFAITKADLLEQDEFTQGVKQLKENIFKPLFAQNGGWFLMFVPVSLGERLTNSEGKVGGTIDPVNVHLPVLFAIRCTLLPELMRLKKELGLVKGKISDTQTSLALEENKSRLKRFWNGDHRKEFENEISELASSHAELASKVTAMEDDLYKISQEIISGQSVVYCDGVEMTL